MHDGDDSFATHRFSRLGVFSALLAFIACNGLLVLSAVLSLIDIGFDIDPHLQALLISLFAVLTVFFVFRGYSRYRNPWPLALAAAGAIVILARMYILYSKLVESVALAALLIAAGWNWALARHGTAARGVSD